MVEGPLQEIIMNIPVIRNGSPKKSKVKRNGLRNNRNRTFTGGRESKGILFNVREGMNLVNAYETETIRGILSAARGGNQDWIGRLQPKIWKYVAWEAEKKGWGSLLVG